MDAKCIFGGLHPHELHTYVYVCIITPMSPRIRYNLFLDEHQRDALRRIKARDGIPESEQIRRALDEWLERRGEKRKTERRRAATRKRS